MKISRPKLVAHKTNEISRKTFKLAMIPIRKDIERLLTEGTTCGHAKTANTCKNILKHKAALWTFVEFERIEPTNNSPFAQFYPRIMK